MKRKNKYIEHLERLAAISGPVRAFTDEENLQMAKDMAWTQEELNKTSSCNFGNRLNGDMSCNG